MRNHLQLRIGGWITIIGAMTALVVNILHPQGDTALRLLTQTAEYANWSLLHFGIITAAICILVGFMTLSQSFATDTSTALARIGLVIAQVGISVLVVGIAIDGFAAKQLADIWVAAPPESRVAAYNVAFAISQVETALFEIWTLLVFGLPFCLFGGAIWFGKEYPRWLGAVGIGAGAICGFVGIEQYLTHTPSTLVTILFVTGSSVLIVWLIIVGSMMVGKAKRMALATGK